MSGPAFKKVLENRQEECSSGTLVTAPNRMGTLKDSSEVIVRGLHQVSNKVSEIRDEPSRQGSCSFQSLHHDNVMCLNHDSPSLVQTKIMHETEGQVIWVSGGGFYNLGSEDEAVEHLLTELVPEYIDAVRNVLQFDAFGLYNCFGSGPLQLPDNRHPESAADKPNISNMLHEKATQKQKTTQLSIVKSEGNSEGHHTMSSTTNDLPDTYEDYLLDAEYLECGADMNLVPSRGHSTENIRLDQQCKDSGLSHCNVMYEGWCTSSKLVSEANENSFSPNKMTVDERIPVSSEEDMILTSASNPLTGVFNFRTKPRSRHMRRYRHTNSNYLKTFSVEDTCFSSSVPDMKEKVIVNFVRGKYKPAQRYTSRSIAKSSRFSSGTCEYSAVSKDMIRPKKSVRQCPREGLRPRVLIHGSGKKNSEAASTGMLSGVPLEQRSMEKGNEFEDSADSVSAGSDVDFNIGLCSVESQETSSEGSFLSAAKTHKSNNSKRQRHIPWSHEEVLQLVDGVSKHGVGKWTDIKKVSFPLSPHRSAVDLKDKWRNLVRASCRFSERKKRVGKGKYWETQYLPDDILHRVKELSCIYPYPRERNFKVSQNVDFSANVSVQNCDKFMPFSMTLKV